jgi:CheY-like chemotaxis protein
MISFDDFTQHLTDAYEHLYDLVYLRTHPMTKLLIRDPQLTRRDQAWQSHHLLLNVVQELDPGSQAPIYSKEWRRHRLMVLRYVDGLSPQVVADQLSISRRHYYRGQQEALEAIAGILWNRYRPIEEEAPAPVTTDPTNRLELLRLEAARLQQTERFADLEAVLNGVLKLLQDRISQQCVTIDIALPQNPLPVLADKRLLRQLLLAVFGYLVDAADSRLWIRSEVRDNTLELLCTISSDETRGLSSERLLPFEELANLASVSIEQIQTETHVGYQFNIPMRPQYTVLVIDDNEDILALFQLYLSLHHYHVVTTSNTQTAFQLAQQLQPLAITLDLMMPDQDGWDLLQTFLHHPNTNTTPIIVCSVLRQKELALSLGATAFLEKPVSEEALLEVLTALNSADTLNKV